MNGFDLRLRTRVFGNGAFERLGDALAAAGKGDLDHTAIGTMVKQQRVP